VHQANASGTGRTSSTDSMDFSERSWASIDLSNHTSFDSSTSGMIQHTTTAPTSTSTSYHNPSSRAGSGSAGGMEMELPSVSEIPGKKSTGRFSRDEWDTTDALYCFKYLLVFNAALESFAHGLYCVRCCFSATLIIATSRFISSHVIWLCMLGANDTANSTGPFRCVKTL
jgi:phosphate/sulfate permease